MSYLHRQKILFRYCDPDGFVFYPRLVEIINDAVEGFFADVLDWPFEEMLETGGTPTVNLNIDFHAPAVHGDRLELALDVVRLGRSSLELSHKARACGTPCFSARHTLVRIGAKEPRGAEPWPDPVRARIETVMKGTP